MNSVEGNQQRLAWMQAAAVNADIPKSTADLFGLWSFATRDDPRVKRNLCRWAG